MDVIAKSILTLFFILIGVLVAIFCYLWFDDVGNCASDGDIWDYNEERCRSDCLAFSKRKGCVYMDKEFQQLFENCAKKSAQCDEKRYAELSFELCKKYQGAWHKKNKTCWFDYATEYCQRSDVECL